MRLVCVILLAAAVSGCSSITEDQWGQMFKGLENFKVTPPPTKNVVCNTAPGGQVICTGY